MLLRKTDAEIATTVVSHRFGKKQAVLRYTGLSKHALQCQLAANAQLNCGQLS